MHQPRCCEGDGIVPHSPAPGPSPSTAAGAGHSRSAGASSPPAHGFMHCGGPSPHALASSIPASPRYVHGGRGAQFCCSKVLGDRGKIFLTWVCPLWRRCARLPEDVVWSEVLAEDFCYNFCSSGVFKSSVHPDSVCCPGEMYGIAGCYILMSVQSSE